MSSTLMYSLTSTSTGSVGNEKASLKSKQAEHAYNGYILKIFLFYLFLWGEGGGAKCDFQLPQNDRHCTEV